MPKLELLEKIYYNCNFLLFMVLYGSYKIELIVN